MHHDYARADRQRFLQRYRPLITEATVAHVISAVLGGLVVIAVIGGRYVG